MAAEGFGVEEGSIARAHKHRGAFRYPCGGGFAESAHKKKLGRINAPEPFMEMRVKKMAK